MEREKWGFGVIGDGMSQLIMVIVDHFEARERKKMVEWLGRERVFIYGLITRIKVWTRWLFLWILVVDKFNSLFAVVLFVFSCSCVVCI